MVNYEAHRMKKKRNDRNNLYTIPAVILVCLTIYIPFVMSGYYSLTKWNGIAKEPIFIGLENFKQIFIGNSDFLTATIFTMKYALVFIIFTNIISLALAVALVKKFNGHVLRGIFFVPYDHEYDDCRLYLEVHFPTGICKTG